MSGWPTLTIWPVSTSRSVTFPDTRKPRLLWMRAETTPVNPRAAALAGWTVATRTSWVPVRGSPAGPVADSDGVQAARPIALSVTSVAKPDDLKRDMAGWFLMIANGRGAAALARGAAAGRADQGAAGPRERAADLAPERVGATGRR